MQYYTLSFDLVEIALFGMVISNLFFLWRFRKKSGFELIRALLVLSGLSFIHLLVYKFYSFRAITPGLMLLFTYGPILHVLTRQHIGKAKLRYLALHFIPVLIIGLTSLLFDSTAHLPAFIIGFGHLFTYICISLSQLIFGKKSSTNKLIIPVPQILIAAFALVFFEAAEFYFTMPYPGFRFAVLWLGLNYLYIAFALVYFKAKKLILVYQQSKNGSTRYESSKLSKTDSATLAARIEYYMQQHRPYRDEDLTLAKLAQHFEVPPRYLSQAINENFSCNFFDFVNNYRVNEARQMLTSETYRDHKIYEIMYDVGFRSRSSFNAAIKKHTGLSPKAYREKFS